MYINYITSVLYKLQPPSGEINSSIFHTQTCERRRILEGIIDHSVDTGTARQSLAARSGTEETWFGEPVVECVASAGCWRQQDRGPVVLAVSRCNADVSSRVVSESHLGSLASPTHSICDIYISRVQGGSWSIKSTNAVKIFSLFICQFFLHTLYFLFMCAFTTS